MAQLWGSGRASEEVGSLTTEREALAVRLAEAHAANARLQMELERVTRRSGEPGPLRSLVPLALRLERLGGDADVLNAVTENRDLRSQLAPQQDSKGSFGLTFEVEGLRHRSGATSQRA